MAKRYAVRSTRVRVEPVERGERADERLLDEIVGVVGVPGEAVPEAAQPRLVLGVELLPGRPVAGLEPPDERGVSPRRRNRHRPNPDGFRR